MKKISDSFRRQFACTVLTGKANYAVWAYTIKNHLITAGLEDYINEKSEPASTDGKVATTISRAQEAKSMLISTLNEQQVAQIIHCESALEIWKHLESAYGKKTVTNE